jgi:hemerythrin-like domain-containing protein
MAISRSSRKTERAALFETPAGFDDPLEMLLGCHRRIERQLETLKRLRAHTAARGVDAEASAAAQAILKYFLAAAPHHHADEEQDVFPLLEQRVTDPGERARFQAFRTQLEADHRELEGAWSRLRKPLEAIGEGLVRTLPADAVHAFIAGYARHILAEENALREFFDRWLGDADREALGRAMAARRTTPAARP